MKPDVKIVILQRGWVFVGRFFKEDQDCRLEGAFCLRRWGTTQGLGQLLKGPLRDTVLDKVGTVRFHELTVVASIDCDGDSWLNHCD